MNFISKTYKLTNIQLSEDVIQTYVNQFWNDIFKNIIQHNTEKHLLILCKAHFTDSSGYKTLGNLRKVNFSDKEAFINFLSARLSVLSDAYSVNPVSKISFTYIIKNGLATPGDRDLLMDQTSKTLITHKFSNVNLPITMNPSEYGTLISKTTIDNNIRYVTTTNKRVFQLDISKDGKTNHVNILGLSDFKWTDTKLSDNGNYFKREIGKSTIYFRDGVIVLRKQELAVKPFVKTSIDRILKNNFVCMDIETINQASGKLLPYLLCAYNGGEYIESYGKNQKELFTGFLNGLLKFFFNGNNKLVVYAHNFGGFDGIFLMKHLVNYGKVEPLVFNGRIIFVKLRLNLIGYTNKTIIFKDSFMFLPLGLRQLAKAFKVVLPKGYFPFKLVNISYTGVFPKFEYWTGINFSQWSELKTKHGKNLWSFREQSIKYCKLDCKVLHEVMTIFNEIIFKEFHINVHSLSTF